MLVFTTKMLILLKKISNKFQVPKTWTLDFELILNSFFKFYFYYIKLKDRNTYLSICFLHSYHNHISYHIYKNIKT